ncbi:MAG: helix-turn-helix domain-containing protein [Patescibacteria group bacterium]
MRRKYNLRKIVSKRSYTTEEIAELFKVHVQTVRTWRKDGMQPIEQSSSPYLFFGSAVRAFLVKELNKKKVKLSENEFYCIRCNKAVTPTSTSMIDRNITIGKDKQSIFLVGTCPDCGLEVRRFAIKEQQQSVQNNKPKENKKHLEKIQKEEPKTTLKKQMSLFETDGREKDY